ncbi:hypothetical protein SERLA73DRAFT_185791, partial [Serpula lacrymans var. lacrymans S7.3]
MVFQAFDGVQHWHAQRSQSHLTATIVSNSEARKARMGNGTILARPQHIDTGHVAGLFDTHSSTSRPSQRTNVVGECGLEAIHLSKSLQLLIKN